MIIGDINKFIVHFIGNKNNGDGVRFSNILTEFENVEGYIKQLISNSFKSEEIYKFHFNPNLELNPMYQFIHSIFKDKESFIEQSQNAGRYLYDKSTHSRIKGGEFFVVHFNDCQINNEIVDCIGLFKSENKDSILKVKVTEDGFNLKDEEGINTNKLDKGCLIFNLEEDDGYLISVVGNINKNFEAKYWKDEFLGIRSVRNDYHQTKQFLGIAKQFVTKQLTEDFEVNKTDQIDLLNRSVEYFKTNEQFEKEEFEKSVFQEDYIIKSFQSFEDAYIIDNDVELSNSFGISSQAVKKQAIVFKSVLKLDKNFDIYIHGDKRLIEKGVENNGRKYYKIYYENEM